MKQLRVEPFNRLRMREGLGLKRCDEFMLGIVVFIPQAQSDLSRSILNFISQL